MLRRNITGANASTKTSASDGVALAGQRYALRGLLYSSILTSGLLLVNGMAIAPANAGPCTTATNSANATQCLTGTTNDTLTYVTSNPDYVNGDFTLTLEDHTVNGTTDGITFGGLIGGNGTIEIEGTSIVDGNDGHGISASVTNSHITVDVKDQSSVTGSQAGINAVATNGHVSVTTEVGTTVEGNGGGGIFASATSTGNVTVSADGAVTGSLNGINANTAGGTVTVTTGTGAITGEGANGITAMATGEVEVETGGTVTGSTNGINAQSTDGGNVAVTTAEGLNETLGNDGDGINASATGIGTITITNNSATAGTDAGIEATSATGAISIINNGIVANYDLDVNDIADPAKLAIRTTGGPATIENNAVIVGRIVTGVGADRLINDEFWYTEGTSEFGEGTDTIDNNAVIYAAHEADVAETTTFAGLENLNNNNDLGGISLRDQDTGDELFDRLITSGNYNGGGGGLALDAYLGGSGSEADVFEVRGNTGGVTEVFVNDTNAGPGGYNPDGILVVQVDGNSSTADFVLADGPIDKGLFFYDLLFDDNGEVGEHRLYGLPDREAFEALAAVSSSQEIWRESADAWSTRQANLRDSLAGSQTVTAVADPAVTVSDAPVGSLWASALGSWSERDDNASFSLLNTSYDFDMSYSQDIYGMVGGADFRAEMGGNTSMLFGVMGGYVDSKLDYDEGSTSIDTSGGTIGAYAAVLSNGFFATVLVKADLLNMDYTAGSLATDDNDDAGVTSWGARGDLGYRFGGTLFVEPMLSVDAISTKIDEFSIGGVDIDAGTNESFRAGAGLRAGYGGETVRASATARIWDVFSTDNEVEIVADMPLGISDDDMEGVYGDVSGQVDVNLSSSTTIYLKGGILFSDDVTKPNASGGFAFSW